MAQRVNELEAGDKQKRVNVIVNRYNFLKDALASLERASEAMDQARRGAPSQRFGDDMSGAMAGLYAAKGIIEKYVVIYEELSQFTLGGSSLVDISGE